MEKPHLSMIFLSIIILKKRMMSTAVPYPVKFQADFLK